MSIDSHKEMEGEEPLVQARKAINYALIRICDNPQIGWHMGSGTQAFSLLTEAHSTLTGKPVEEIRRRFAPVFKEKTDTELVREIKSAFEDAQIYMSQGRNVTQVSLDFIAKVKGIFESPRTEH